MDNEQAAGVIKALREERSELEHELKALDSIIARFERRSPNTPSIEQGTTSPRSVIAPLFPVQENYSVADKDNNFPLLSDLESQIVYVLNSLKKAQRYPEIQDRYTKLSGSKRNIRKDLQAFRKSGVLVAIKYNNNSTQLYQGLPDWVIETEKGPIFKEDFIDITDKNFPTGVWKSVRVEEENS